MVTIRGRDVDVSRFTYELLELDMDAVETYRISSERLQDGEAKRMLREFMQDHERHISELTPIAQRMGGSVPPAIDVERVKAKVTLSQMGGDRGILAGLKEMEDATNLAYEQGTADENIDEDVKDVFERGLEDERRHRAWLEERVEQMGLRVTSMLDEDEDVDEELDEEALDEEETDLDEEVDEEVDDELDEVEDETEEVDAEEAGEDVDETEEDDEDEEV